jgi:NTP pyrophosphatase (non-canonical NTP hydrolase)
VIGGVSGGLGVIGTSSGFIFISHFCKEFSVNESSIARLSLNQLSAYCHTIAKEKGFWDADRNVGEMLMLITSELAEAMEGYRHQDEANFREEIADAFIRLFDLCGGLGIDIESEIDKKTEKNKNRPYKHGKIC